MAPSWKRRSGLSPFTREPSPGPAAGPYAPLGAVELMVHLLAGRPRTQACLAVMVLDKILQFS